MESTSQSAGAGVREISLPLFESKGWMKLLGVLSILDGIVLAFTLFGIIVAWLPVWIGILLWQSASAIERAAATGDEKALVASLRKLKTYFTIQGILMLLTIAFIVILLSFGAMGLILGLLS